VTIYTHRNGTVRVEDSEADLYASIDLVCDKVRGAAHREGAAGGPGAAAGRVVSSAVELRAAAC
jgi:hypothetical protein